MFIQHQIADNIILSNPKITLISSTLTIFKRLEASSILNQSTRLGIYDFIKNVLESASEIYAVD